MKKKIKKFIVEGKQIVVSLKRKTLKIVNIENSIEIYSFKAKYKTEQEANLRFTNYDYDNARAFVAHLLNPYLINL